MCQQLGTETHSSCKNALGEGKTVYIYIELLCVIHVNLNQNSEAYSSYHSGVCSTHNLLGFNYLFGV